MQEVQCQTDREKDQMATRSLKLLERALRKVALPDIRATTIGRNLHEEGYSVQRDRTWCQTGSPIGCVRMVSTASMIPMRRKKSLIELTYQVLEACGLPLWGQDEAGPYVSRPQLGTSWQLQGKARLQPH